MSKERHKAGNPKKKSLALRDAADLEDVKQAAMLVNNHYSFHSLPRRKIMGYAWYDVGEIGPLREMLKGYSVEDVKELIYTTENDKTRTAAHVRNSENTIHNIIFNQPHNTKEFAEFYSLQRKPIAYRYHLGFYMTLTPIIAVTGFLSFLIYTYIGFGLFPEIFTSLGSVSIPAVLTMIPIALIASSILKSDHKHDEAIGESIYGEERYNKTLQEYDANLLSARKKEEEDRRKRLEYKAGALNRRLSAHNSEVNRSTSSESENKPVPNLSLIQADYDKAVAVITSYELDIIKAVKYPAFNDITVAETREMHTLLQEAGYALNVSDAFKAQKLVSKLTTAVKVAEKNAMRLAWSDMTESEQKDLQLAQNLIIQVNDVGNTEEMRAVLYERLRKVVERLNSTHIIVPKSTVVLIEERSRKELTQN